MNKIIKLFISILAVLSLSGCTSTAKGAVEEYLNKYTSLSDTVISDMDDIVKMENLSEDQEIIYQDIFKKQYTDLMYEIQSEEYDGDEATIEVKITVYDLYKVQKQSLTYLTENPDEFNDEAGIYDANKYITYKLNQMKMAKDKIDYTIEFYAVKSNNGWEVSPLSNSDLEKIHGIYNYES